MNSAVSRSDGAKFWLTARVLQLGAGLIRAGGLRNSVAPHVIDLADRLNEPCSVSVLDGSDTLFVCRDATRRIFTTRLGVGDRLPAHCSASEDAVGLPSGRSAPTRSGNSPPGRPHTGPDHRSRAFAQRARGDARGYGLAIDEMEDCTLPGAVPLRDRSGRVIAAMSLASHRMRRTPGDLDGPLLAELRSAAPRVDR